jgi:hypothetical protein
LGNKVKAFLFGGLFCACQSLSYLVGMLAAGGVFLILYGGVIEKRMPPGFIPIALFCIITLGVGFLMMIALFVLVLLPVAVWMDFENVDGWSTRFLRRYEHRFLIPLRRRARRRSREMPSEE